MNSQGKKTPTTSPPKTLESLLKEDETVEELDGILASISFCTFTDLSEPPSQQELKHESLIKLLSMLKTPKKTVLRDHNILSGLINMISSNLFRSFPPPPKPSSLFTSEANLPDGDDPVISKLSKTWSHLQIIHEILLNLVVKTDPKTLASLIDKKFLANLLSLFQSVDPRERECVKSAYHKIYLRSPSHRGSMRKAMSNAFLSHVADDSDAVGVGVGELLEVWGSIISGFTVPLKEEHRLFLMRVLVPLHKTKGVQWYHVQLAYCVAQFVHKEPALGGVVVRGVLKYWPVCNCQKEVLFIGELEDVVEIIDRDQYRKLALPLCLQITKCLNSWNSQVAERALYVWNNEHFVKMAQMATEEVFPIVAEGVERNLRWHWSKSVRQLTANVKAMLQEMEPILYSKWLREKDQRDSTAREAEIRRKEKWERIETVAAKNHRLIQQRQ